MHNWFWSQKNLDSSLSFFSTLLWAVWQSSSPLVKTCEKRATNPSIARGFDVVIKKDAVGSLLSVGPALSKDGWSHSYSSEESWNRVLSTQGPGLHVLQSYLFGGTPSGRLHQDNRNIPLQASVTAANVTHIHNLL